jgi:DNA mismatch repair protein MutS
VFMHSVKEGPANQSYGLQVAGLAGVPRTVIERARTRLRELESAAREHADREQPQLALFGQEEEPAAPAADPLRERLAAISPDELSPRQALELLYELSRLAAD